MAVYSRSTPPIPADRPCSVACSCSTSRSRKSCAGCRLARAFMSASSSIGSRADGRWHVGCGRCSWRVSMPDLEVLKERGHDLWREIRADHRPVIAPYPERTPPKPWKWDRPLDKVVGRLLVDPPIGKTRLLERAERIAEGDAELRGLGQQA